MPLYEYLCKQCGNRFEKIQKFSEQPLTECPKCKGELVRPVTAPALQFKGAGWYINDYSALGSAHKKAVTAESAGVGSTDAAAGAASAGKTESTAASAPSSGGESAATPAAAATPSTPTATPAAAPSTTSSK